MMGTATLLLGILFCAEPAEFETLPDDQVIPGLLPVDVYGNLTSKGFSKEGPKKRPNGLHFIVCKLSEGGVSYTVEIMHVGTKVRSIYAEAKADEPAKAKAFFGYLATLTYEGSSPSKAKDWVETNIAETTHTSIGGVRFSLSQHPGDVVFRIDAKGVWKEDESDEKEADEPDAGDLKKKVTSYLDRFKSEKSKIVEKLEQTISGLTNADKVDDPKVAEQRKSRLDRSKEWLKRIKTGSGLPPVFIDQTLSGPSVGDVGYILTPCVVRQVISDRESLIELRYDQLAYLEEFDTSGFVDGKSVDLSAHLFEIPSNKSYQAIAGTRTVLLIKPIDADEFEESASTIVEVEEPPKKEKKRRTAPAREPDDPALAESRAKLKLEAAKRNENSNRKKAIELAEEAIQIAPESEAAKEAEALLKKWKR